MTKKQIKDLIIKSDYKNDSHRPVIRWSYENQNIIGGRFTKEAIWHNGYFYIHEDFFLLHQLIDILYDYKNTYRNFELIVGGATPSNK